MPVSDPIHKGDPGLDQRGPLGGARATIGELEKIIDATEAHDAERAEQLVREHMRQTGRIRLEMLRTQSR